MADNIHLDKLSGEHALYLADQPGWHGLGNVVNARTWEEVIKIAHLNWTVSKHPLYGKIDDNYVQLPTWGIFRDDTNAFLGSVGKGYTPVQNEYQFKFLNALMESDENTFYESAGVLGNGEKVWAMARIPHDFTVGPTSDKHETYLLFTTSHNGSLSAQCRLTTVRVVCQNTLNAAVNMNGTFIKIKHTKEAEKRLDAARKLMNNAVQSVSSLKEKLEILGQKMLDKESYLRILNRVFPAPKGKEDESSTRRNNVLTEVTRLFEHNDGNMFPEHRGTAFNLLNAITEYTDHIRGTRLTEDRKHLTEEQARTEAAIFGSGSDLKENALEVLLEETVSCKDRPYKSFTQRAIGSGEYEKSDPVDHGNGLLDNILDEHYNN